MLNCRSRHGLTTYMRSRVAFRLAVAAAVTCVVAAGGGCGGESGSSLPGCARHGPAVTPPAPFPGSFPLPDGTVLTSYRHGAGGFLIVEGVQPLGLQEAARFLVRELPLAGYRLGEGDSEGDEAETDFSGHGLAGRVKVRALQDCEEATTIAISVVRR